ncbi:hypothetical protein FACS1894139_18230 [Planctomycetales bacterium]|nr:hypothetical protein FACS1894107_07770 [Planctomycetales bacterium]GHT08492.1 hypothetical protein FACS1894139_18230 [Planctomycetales bacterium]
MSTTFSPGAYVNTNINALGTSRYLGGSNRMLTQSLARLSSGYKINVASDDPSGLQISEQLRSQGSGITRAIQNSQEASNVIGIAEGALIEINNILTKMRQLAIHAANEGATSPEQVTADQAEIDSGIQTIDRIANTTRFSDQFLLNGSKSLIFRASTTVNDPMDNPLIDVTNSRVDQISKRGDQSPLAINFTGYDTTNPGMPALGDRQARRAVLECDKTLAGNNNTNAWVPDVIDGYITAPQRFILTGNSGAKAYSFLDGTHLGVIAQGINNSKGSTGIGATLTFDSSVSGSQVDLTAMSTDGTAAVSGERLAGQAAIYNRSGAGVAEISISTDGATFNENSLVPGMNLDGDGRMYLRWTDATTYVAYKDENFTMEIGRGKTGSPMTSSNNSGVAAAQITITATAPAPQLGDVSALQFGQQFELRAGATDGSVAANGMKLDEMTSLATAFGLDMTSGASCLSGMRLQGNTSEDARLYFGVTYDETKQETTVKIFTDGSMLPQYLVAAGTADASSGNPYQVAVQEVDYQGKPSGVYATLSLGAVADLTQRLEGSGTLEFNQLGLRVYSDAYGSEQYLRAQNLEGHLLGGYAASDSYELQPIAVGDTLQATGGDALVAVNGSVAHTQGLAASVSSQSYSGELAFYAGELGMTTLAQVGQDVGALASRGGALQAVAPAPGEDPFDPNSQGYLSWATNGRHNTNEQVRDFVGGMQYQLGEGENEVERTIYSIPSMAVANLGKTEVRLNVVYSLQDVLSGGDAALAQDPVAAMKIIRQAIDDVTGTRARLGAFQKNMLATNANSLEVTVENITKTESYIRDTDMATESTEYTKNQILVQAGTSMLAQANKIPQNVLSLLG